MKVDKINFFVDKDREARFVKSLRDTGFAVITGSPIPGDLLNNTYASWAEFFKRENKLSYKFNPESQSGFFPMRSENAKNAPAKDLKEFFHLFKTSDLPEDMDKTTLILRSHLLQMAEILLGWIQKESPQEVTSQLSMPLIDMIKGSDKNLFRVLHYPPLIDPVSEGEVRAAAHEDINLITLLPAATEAGLEVLDSNGEWHEVPCDRNSIIVNSGDMLQMATSGYFKSTTHRVVNPRGQAAKLSRYSIPFFVHPRGEVVLAPKGSGLDTTAAQYLAERLSEIGLKK